ncbi:glycosyltransferase [Providencia sp. PROV032]|uniref:glycosyltransferase n=1 Tax=Providencia sp. PROV032 TaxID=2949764 RepID=UPI00234A0439|nr:glycosyltransferase [Providencia sp. PROV032]
MNLIVIGEPHITTSTGSRNNALNNILEHYSNFNSTTTYVSSTTDVIPNSYIINNVRYVPLTNYTKSNRLILKNKKEIISKIKELINDKDYHIQFRIPSIYVLQVYFCIKSIISSDRFSFYVAGDWKESLKYNYPSKKHLAFILPKLENLTIRNKKCVFTGDTLLNKNIKYIKKGIAFYSTTHSFNDLSREIKDKSDCNGICFIGRIEKLKNYNFIIELAKSHLGKKYLFHILGDGPDMPILKKTINELKLTNILIYGHITDMNSFNQIIDKCKYSILPSYTEGTSKTLPEMMCRSTIPIAFKNVGSNNFILGENRGILTDINDINQVLENIDYIDNNYQKYCEIQKNEREYIVNFTIEKQLEKMFKFLYDTQKTL